MSLSVPNDSLSFNIDNRIFSTPAELIPPAQQSLKFRQTLVEQMDNGRLVEWFRILGKQNWVEAYNEVASLLSGLSDYNSEDRKMAALQVLLQNIDPTLPKPTITSSSKTINLPTAEATGTITLAILYELQYKGILKAVLDFDGATEGVSVSERIIDFNSLTGYTQAKILLEIDTTCFPQNKPAKFELIAKTLSGQLAIPVHLHVLFPKRAYTLILLKYGLACTFLSAIAAWIFNFAHGNSWVPAIAIGFAVGIACGGVIAGKKYRLKPIYAVLPVLLFVLVLAVMLNNWL